MTIEDFDELKKEIETIREKKSRAEGALEQINSSLKEFNVNSIEEAQELLESLSKDIASDEEKIEKILNEIDELLGNNNE